MPDVSIIIPVHNRPSLVLEAIESARRASTELSLEVIVVDDASTDQTWDVLAALADVIAMRQPVNGGQSQARNAGIHVATGEYLKFLDSDDVLVPGHLDREVAAARATGAEIVVSGWETHLATGEVVSSPAPVFCDIVDELLAGRAVPTSSALYRRGRTVLWDPALRKLDDWDFFVQSALGVASIATVEGSAYWLRDHGGQRATSASMVVNAREHHLILSKIEERLLADGKLTEARKRRLGQYFYKELRVLSLFDRPAFEAAVRHVYELDPYFYPVDEERQRWMRVAARLIGTRHALLLHSSMKRWLKR